VREIGLEVQIETAGGMEKIDQIASSSPRVKSLIFGPIDFATSIHSRLSVASSTHDYFLLRILVAARANNLLAIDGPYPQIRDLEGLKAAAEHAATLGFDGKWALHPTQVDPLNVIFSPSPEEFDKANAILEVYRQNGHKGDLGAFVFNDEMIDAASRRFALSVIQRGEALGMEARPWQPTV
jgi:citrate lyase subunit beta/citryl-CoA lyase